jgi:hypothetical protein
MIAALEGAEFNGKAISTTQAQNLVSKGQALLKQVKNLAAAP